ncbi:pyruvate kinase, partial [bacterium]|nr:pyruvate kinase [bacterium]
MFPMEKTLPGCKTKIVCTIGPASRDREVLKNLILSGMNVARINFSHGEPEGHIEDINAVREIARDLGVNVAILADLPGPKIRIGVLKDGSCMLAARERVTLTTRDTKGTASVIPVQFREFAESVDKGERIFLNDGFIELKVLEKTGTDVLCEVVMGGQLLSKKGINLPDSRITVAAVTDRDLDLIAFGLEHEIDMFGLSFVGNAGDIRRAREFAAGRGREIFLVSKIERPQALTELDGIIDATDAVMVARGDLGVEIPIEEVPIVQKQVILKANMASKPVITATQMLESMVGNTRPTRAEVTDVANAIFDGTDAVMLSEETAIGSHPTDACRMLARIAASAESRRSTVVSGTVVPDAVSRNVELFSGTVEDTISLEVIRSGANLCIDTIAVPTRTGLTARKLSRFKGNAWIIALCR